MVGTRFLLWRREWRQIATTSSRVGTDSGWIVLEEVPIIVIEQRNDVPGMFGNGTFLGLKARADDGREFTRNWDSYPDDAMTGATSRWYHINRDDGAPFEDFVDAIQASSIFYRAIGGQYYDEQGEFKVPTGAEICMLHGDTFLVGATCSECSFDAHLRNRDIEVTYIKCPFCDAKRRAGENDKALRGLHIRWDHPQEFLRLTNAELDPNDWEHAS